jgi:hypothetical protein
VRVTANLFVDWMADCWLRGTELPLNDQLRCQRAPAATRTSSTTTAAGASRPTKALLVMA